MPSTEAWSLWCASSYFQMDGMDANVCDPFFREDGLFFENEKEAVNGYRKASSYYN